jgi:tetratricopeptide (TPR) repeat protein
MMMRYKMLLTFVLTLAMFFCASSEKRMAQRRSTDPQYQYNVGLVYLQNGKYDEAIQYFQKSLSFRPNYDLALNAMGLACFMKGEFQQAVTYFEKCLQVNPDFMEARNYLGSVYQEMGILDKAEQEYRKAIADETYKSRELPYYNLARLYFAQGKDKEALELVDKSIAVNNRMIMSLNLRGVILERLGQLDKAISSYSEALQIAPDDINLNYNLAVAFFKSDRRAEAKSLFEKIFSQVTDSEMKTKIEEYLKVLK